MHLLESTILTTAQKQDILRLWNSEYSVKLQYGSLAEFEAYLDGLTGHKHYLLTLDDGRVMGWAFTFTRNQEKWFAIILDQSIQRQGYGRQLLDVLKNEEPVLNGWATDHGNDVKANGQPYLSPVEFYVKNGFSVVADCRLEFEKLSAVKIVWSRQ